MLEELNKKLMEVKERLRMKQKLVEKVKGSEQALSKEKTRLEELEATLRKEGRDVEMLVGLSLKGLFYTVLGSKEDQLEKERQEYLVVKLKMDECTDSVSMLMNRLEEMKIEIKKLGDIETRYQVIFEEKEKFVLASSDTNTAKLLQITEKVADVRSDIKELKEALNTGNEALTGINEVIDSLQSAKGWGTWDMLGGGLILTAIKHSRIDDARKSVHRIQHQLRVFQKELNDVDPNLKSEITIDIGSLATFADYFFDGLITDWIVQSKITDSLGNAVNVGDKVIETLKSLQIALDMCQKKLEALEEQKRMLVENCGVAPHIT